MNYKKITKARLIELLMAKNDRTAQKLMTSILDSSKTALIRQTLAFSAATYHANPIDMDLLYTADDVESLKLVLDREYEIAFSFYPDKGMYVNSDVLDCFVSISHSSDEVSIELTKMQLMISLAITVVSMRLAAATKT